MNINLNGSALDFSMDNVDTVQGLLKKIEETVLKDSSKENILLANINDKNIMEYTQLELQSLKLNDIKKIDLQVTTQKEVFLSGLEQARDMIISIKIDANNVINNIHSNHKQKAFLELSVLSKKWKEVINIIQFAGRFYNINFDSIIINGQKIGDLSNDLIEFLGELKSAMQNSDLVTLGDIIEYELLPRFDNQEELIEILLDKIK